jgi:hypothetical protein
MPHSQKQKMLAGELYSAADPEIQADARGLREWILRIELSIS